MVLIPLLLGLPQLVQLLELECVCVCERERERDYIPPPNETHLLISERLASDIMSRDTYK